MILKLSQKETCWDHLKSDPSLAMKLPDALKSAAHFASHFSQSSSCKDKKQVIKNKDRSHELSPSTLSSLSIASQGYITAAE